MSMLQRRLLYNFYYYLVLIMNSVLDQTLNLYADQLSRARGLIRPRGLTYLHKSCKVCKITYYMLRNFFATYGKIDFFALSETNIHRAEPEKLYSVSDFFFISRSRCTGLDEKVCSRIWIIIYMVGNIFFQIEMFSDLHYLSNCELFILSSWKF